jgi:FkbM family methyltransferase
MSVDLRSPLYKYLRAYPQWHFSPPRVRTVRRLERFGSDYGGYFLDPSLIPVEPIIYSLGVGEDVSFDLGLIKRFRCTVHAFDPTPKVKLWIESQSLPPEFTFHPVGIADFDGVTDFYLPPRPDFISHSLVRAPQYSDCSIRVPVARLSTIMRNNGHTRIDVLKMDIEGAEYSVLAELIKNRIPVTQIVAEFHHRLSGVGARKTREILALLNQYGMKICYVCPRLEVMTLVREAETHR